MQTTDTYSRGHCFARLSWRVTKMTTREAIKALMLSPFYFKLDLAARKALIRELCDKAPAENIKAKISLK